MHYLIMEGSLLSVSGRVYQQFDADYTQSVPALGYRGWQSCEVPLDLYRTAVVVMHAWEPYSADHYPGWYRAVEYLPRSKAILRTVFPSFLAELRRANVRLYHVVGDGDYFQSYPGYQRALTLAGPETSEPKVERSASTQRLLAIRSERTFVGSHNQQDVTAAQAVRTFPKEAEPRGQEGIAHTASQLLALCRSDGVEHLIYCGFAVNWCLLMSPAGMIDMSRRGLICSVFEDAVTAVENRESAATEAHKEEALWRVALAFGFVFNTTDFVATLKATPSEAATENR